MNNITLGSKWVPHADCRFLMDYFLDKGVHSYIKLKHKEKWTVVFNEGVTVVLKKGNVELLFNPTETMMKYFEKGDVE